MKNYLTSFDTMAQYSAATLDLPNVSLIKTTGEVKYKNLFAGATLGDILMYDVANDKLVTTIGGEWSSTAYPIADYYPIGINVYPADQTSDGKTRFMSIRWASNATSEGNKNNVDLCWGLNGDITSTDENVFNGRENTDKALLEADGTSANTQEAFAAFYACNIFAPSGTTAGDWYLPSYKELSLYAANYSDINAQLTLIKNADSNVLNSVNSNQRSSTQSNNNDGTRFLKSSGDWWVINRSYPYAVRAMISL